MVKGKVYKACVQGVLVYGSETWPKKIEDMQRIGRAQRMMVPSDVQCDSEEQNIR